MIARNAIAQLVGLIGIVLLQAIYAVLGARILGVEDFGKLAFIVAISQFFVIAGDMGLNNTILRRISAGPQLSSMLFPPFFSLRLILSGLLFVIFMSTTLYLESPGERAMPLLFGFGMFFHSTNSSLNVVFQAHGKLYLASLNNFLITFFQVILGVLFLLNGGQLPSLGIAYLISNLLALATNYVLFTRSIHSLELRPPSGWKTLLRESLPVGLGALFQVASSRFPIAILTLLSGSHQTGLFSAAHRITLVLSNVPAAILSAFLPAMASLQGDSKSVRQLLVLASFLMLILALPFSLFMGSLAPFTISLLFGPAYLPAAEVLSVLSWALTPLFLGKAFEHVLLSQTNLIRFHPVVSAIILVVNGMFCLLLIPSMGAQGAATATLVTEGVLALLYFLATFSFLFGRSHRKSY